MEGRQSELSSWKTKNHGTKLGVSSKALTPRAVYRNAGHWYANTILLSITIVEPLMPLQVSDSFLPSAHNAPAKIVFHYSEWKDSQAGLIPVSAQIINDWHTRKQISQLATCAHSNQFSPQDSTDVLKPTPSSLVIPVYPAWNAESAHFEHQEFMTLWTHNQLCGEMLNTINPSWQTTHTSPPPPPSPRWACLECRAHQTHWYLIQESGKKRDIPIIPSVM